jgi:hypothetical protein
MSLTTFHQINKNWNAEPNAPYEELHVIENKVVLSFDSNEETKYWLIFPQCWRFRIGATNDEGWHKGDCRFSKIAPEWGHFYLIEGELLENKINDWKVGPSKRIKGSKHFLFYLRDSTFECDASGFNLVKFPQNNIEIGCIPNWSEKRKQLLYEAGGTTDKKCIKANCNEFSINGKWLCVDHSFPEFSGKFSCEQ